MVCFGAGEGVTTGGAAGVGLGAETFGVVGAGVTTGVGAGATVTAGVAVGVVAAGVGVVSFTEVVTCCSGVWLCFESSTFVGEDVVGMTLLEHPLMANNSAMNIPAIFMFHEDFKQSTPFFNFFEMYHCGIGNSYNIQYYKSNPFHATGLMVMRPLRIKK